MPTCSTIHLQFSKLRPDDLNQLVELMKEVRTVAVFIIATCRRWRRKGRGGVSIVAVFVQWAVRLQLQRFGDVPRFLRWNEGIICGMKLDYPVGVGSNLVPLHAQ